MKETIGEIIRGMTREEVKISIRSHYLIDAERTTWEKAGERVRQLVSDVAKQVISGTLVLI